LTIPVKNGEIFDDDNVVPIFDIISKIYNLLIHSGVVVDHITGQMSGKKMFARLLAMLGVKKIRERRSK
jgi:hypothetical protein